MFSIQCLVSSRYQWMNDFQHKTRCFYCIHLSRMFNLHQHQKGEGWANILSQGPHERTVVRCHFDGKNSGDLIQNICLKVSFLCRDPLTSEQVSREHKPGCSTSQQSIGSSCCSLLMNLFYKKILNYTMRFLCTSSCWYMKRKHFPFPLNINF